MQGQVMRIDGHQFAPKKELYAVGTRLSTRNGLRVEVLGSDPETGTIHVNFLAHAQVTGKGQVHIGDIARR